MDSMEKNEDMVIHTTLQELANGADENEDCGAKHVRIEDLEDLPLYDFVLDFKRKVRAKKKVP